MVGEVLIAASGIAAACERPEMAAAPTSAIAEVLTNFLREGSIAILLLVTAGALGRRGGRARGFRRSAADISTEHRRAEIGFGEPEVALALDRHGHRGD